MRNFSPDFHLCPDQRSSDWRNPASRVAQEQPGHSDHSALVFNEEVVKNTLNGADPDVAFLARIKIMVGHLVCR